jgi:tetratricopeptide (TPR) repeat protein
MSGLRGITILLAISSGQALAFGAPPVPAAPPEKTAQKPAEKVSALEYVKAGAYLYNKGQVDKASKYFQAADRFRSQLSDNEQVVLEVYLEEVENFYKKRPTASRVDPAVAPAATTTAAPTKPDATNAAGPAALPGLEPSTPGLEGLRQPSRFNSTDPKQRARWLLQESREQMALGHYEEAAQKIAEAKALDVKWGFLEESPDKTAKLLERVKAKSPKGPPAPSARPLGVRLPDSNAPQTESSPPSSGRTESSKKL